MKNVLVIMFLNTYLLVKLFSKRQGTLFKVLSVVTFHFSVPVYVAISDKVPTEESVLSLCLKLVSPCKNQSLCMIYNNVHPHLCIHKNNEFGFSPIFVLVKRHKFSKKVCLELY